MTTRSKAWARLTGLLIGCALTAGFVLSGRMPQNGGALGARLTMVAGSTADLAVSPADSFLSTSDLRPGAAIATGKGTLTNRTAAMLWVRPRALASSGDLYDLVRIELTVGGERVFRGRLGDLRHRGARPFGLRPGQKKRVDVRAWLPSSATQGYQARAAKVTLEWKTRAVEA